MELQVRITKQLVADKVGALLKKSDLSKFIL
jgi:ATP-dependent protease HslVU (ClpYQ) ATPase subunit